MAEVSLLVTRAELDYVAAGRQNEQQIAVRSASEDVLDALMQIDGQTGGRLSSVAVFLLLWVTEAPFGVHITVIALRTSMLCLLCWREGPAGKFAFSAN